MEEPHPTEVVGDQPAGEAEEEETLTETGIEEGEQELSGGDGDTSGEESSGEDSVGEIDESSVSDTEISDS